MPAGSDIMSELLHHGNHPDTDQLNAFAEHVLPEHERLETLAHLAECADCRQIVFLAQHAQYADDRLLQEVAGRSGWWKNWRILWPAAAALTCGLLVVVFLQRRHPADLAQRSDVAFESSALVAPSKAPAPRTAAPTVPQPGPPASPQSAAAKAAPSLHPASVVPHKEIGGVASVNGDLAMDKLKDNLSGFNRNVPAAGRHSVNALSVGSVAVGAVIGSSIAQAAPSQERKDSLFPDKREQTAALQSQNQLFSQPAAAPRSLSEVSQDNVPHSTNQTVDVTSAPSVVQTENAIISASVFNPGRAARVESARAPLPSKRFAVSTISNGVETLAVDSAGDLFLSKDGGKSWRGVAHQWTGKAVRVSLASSSSMRQPVSAKASSTGGTASTELEPVTPTAVPPGVGFELTSDTGASWSSSEGLVWKLK
jgi:hypothetical protein